MTLSIGDSDFRSKLTVINYVYYISLFEDTSLKGLLCRWVVHHPTGSCINYSGNGVENFSVISGNEVIIGTITSVSPDYYFMSMDFRNPTTANWIRRIN